MFFTRMQDTQDIALVSEWGNKPSHYITISLFKAKRAPKAVRIGIHSYCNLSDLGLHVCCCPWLYI